MGPGTIKKVRFSLQGELQAKQQQPANKEMDQSTSEDVHIFSNEKMKQLTKEDPEEDKFGFDWVDMLTSNVDFETPPVSWFKHAPLSKTWKSEISIGMKVEVENWDTQQPAPKSYWLASIIKLNGYNALLRYEGFDEDASKDFWVNVADEDIHHIGWCASFKKPLIPPRTIQGKHTDWRQFVVGRLTGATSLHKEFHSRVIEASHRSRFLIGMTLEVVDYTNLSIIRVATVETIIGRRLKLRYFDAPENEPDSFVCCHEESASIHPVGWAFNVGHKIHASAAYLERCLKQNYFETDAKTELFNDPTEATETQVGCQFEEGMMIEAVDPMNSNMICVAMVVKVLQDDYLMIRIDRKPADGGGATEDSTTFCYHATSACIAPPGFCEANKIPLQPPGHYEGDRFDWAEYLLQQKAVAAPSFLFPSTSIIEPQIRLGMRVEAADLLDSHLICPATVAQVAGRLLRIHFDGWSDDYDQWMDSNSPEIYPVGWCELVGYRLEAFKAAAAPSTVAKKKEKREHLPSSSKRERSPSSVGGNRNAAASKAAKRNKSEDKAAPKLRTKSTLKAPSTATSSEEVGIVGTTDGNPNDPQTKTGVSTAAVNSVVINGDGGKKIPKLNEVEPTQQKEALVGVGILDWSSSDVAEFLKMNGYAAFSDAFFKENVDGPKLLSLTKRRVLQLTGLKLEATDKIYNLIRQLKQD